MHNNEHIKITSYVYGFCLSIVLTVIAYVLVAQHIWSGMVLIAALFVLAFIQLTVQLLFFLHLGTEQKPRWNLVFFIATLGIIFIIVVGSLWIINHLNYNMTPAAMEQYIRSQEGGF